VLGIIGGSGLYRLPLLHNQRQLVVETPYGSPSSELTLLAPQVGGEAAGCFLARHGAEHSIPPHKINYRANIQALVDLGADRILAIHAVGSCKSEIAVGRLLLPTQIIDYSYSREQSFFDRLDSFSQHVDFSQPFSATLQDALLEKARALDIPLSLGGTYACTQGPRFETAAEIARIVADGGDLVGMTAMPEAALARERGIDYASLSIVVNPAAGIAAEEGGLEGIPAVLEQAALTAQKIIAALLPDGALADTC